MEINERFKWLEGMDFLLARTKMMLHQPYFLNPYYVNGKCHYDPKNIMLNRINVRVENGHILSILDIG